MLPAHDYKHNNLCTSMTCVFASTDAHGSKNACTIFTVQTIRLLNLIITAIQANHPMCIKTNKISWTAVVFFVMEFSDGRKTHTPSSAMAAFLSWMHHVQIQSWPVHDSWYNHFFKLSLEFSNKGVSLVTPSYFASLLKLLSLPMNPQRIPGLPNKTQNK